MIEFFKKHLGWVVTGFLTLLFWFQTCNLQDKIDKGNQTISQLELDKQTLQTKVNEQGETIWTQQSIIKDNTHALNELTDTIFKLKQKNTETIAYFKSRTNTQVVETEVPYLDSVAMKNFEDSVAARYPELASFVRDSVITVPRTSRVVTSDLYAQLTAHKTGIRIDSLSIPDVFNLRFVEKKGGLFKRSTVEVQYFHSSPYIHSLSANSVIYKPKRKPLFQRVILPVAVGVGAGILISK